MRRLLAVVAVLAVVPSLASAAPFWKGNFETGDLSQWEAKQIVSADRMQVVSMTAPNGNSRAVKVTVKQGDNPINSSGNRNELVHVTPQAEGSESWYRWSTMFATDFPSVNTWQLFTQWHQPEDCCGSPPIQFYVIGEEIRLTLSTAQTLVWRTPLVRGVWHDFIFHVKFSDNGSVGFAELWYDGKQVLPKTYAQTRANTYLKLGLYRNNTISQVGVLYHAGMIQGRTQADVTGGSTTMPAPSTGGDRVWSGNFSTSDFSQWTRLQEMATDRIQLITPPITHENNQYAAKVTVKPGDVASSGNRAQLVRVQDLPEGSEYYYRWSTLFASDYPSTTNWQTFLSLNRKDDVAAPPLQLRTVGEEVQMVWNDQIVWRTPLVRGVWHSYVLHLKYSDYPTVGFVELVQDGQTVLAKRYGQTFAQDYLKLGLNRGGSIGVNSVIYFDGMVQGRTLSSVLPSYVPPAS